MLQNIVDGMGNIYVNIFGLRLSLWTIAVLLLVLLPIVRIQMQTVNRGSWPKGAVPDPWAKITDVKWDSYRTGRFTKTTYRIRVIFSDGYCYQFISDKQGMGEDLEAKTRAKQAHADAVERRQRLFRLLRSFRPF